MGMEDKKDNKVDTSRNGRPINLNLGGEDFFIDLPNAIPGEESATTDDINIAGAEELLSELDKNYDAIEALLKDAGIDLNDLDISEADNK